MNLTVIEKNVINLMPVQQRQFVAAKFTSSIKSTGDLELSEKLLDMVQITLIESGVKDQSDERVIRFISETLFRDLREPKFNHLTLDEIKLALSMGVRHVYGEFMGVNVQTIHKWIKCYLADINRENSIKEYGRLLSKEQAPEPEINKLMFSKDACIKAFEYYKSNKTAPFAAFAYYDIINNLIGVEYKGIKTLVPDSELRKKLYNEVKESYTNGMISNKKRAEFRGNHSLAEAIMSEVSNEFKGHKGFENTVKERYLMAFFDKLINEDKQLTF